MADCYAWYRTPAISTRWAPSATYYAMLSTDELIERARDAEPSALMKALADRLEDVDRERYLARWPDSRHDY